MKTNHVFWLFIFITQSAWGNFVCNINNEDYYAVYEIDTYTCNYGQYLPANTDGCQNCLYGHICSGGTYTFNVTLDQGSVIGVYHCNAGYFLPANSDTCYICPNDFTCPGGTFEFNPDIFQGLEIASAPNNTMNNICADNFPKDLVLIYEPNQHTCAQGYYLPANTDECTKCLNDSYCAGGTYTFSETQTQGITPCPSAHPFAPAGMWQQSQCGRKLHVGDEIMYLHQSPANPTEHRLYTIFNGTVYSVNATQKQNGVPDPKISVGMERSLHIKLNDVEYLLHDDSIQNQ
jgi:hypothetical protein